MAVSIIKKKVVLLGDGAVGKTSLVRRFVIDKFADDYIATIGTKVTKKDLRIEHGGRTIDLTLMLWDILGQKEYSTTHESSIRGAKGAIVVYDVSRPDTAASVLEFWLPLLNRVAGYVPYVMAANKIDLAADRNAEAAKLREMTGGVPGFLCSAKTGEQVEEAFDALGTLLLSQGDVPEPVTIGEEQTAMPGNTVASVTDMVIMDFCKTFGGMESGMPVIRQQFARAGIDVNHPTREGLRRAIYLLAEVERGFRSAAEVDANRDRRLAWLRDAR
jgi:small GTP-binding protein